MPQKTISGYKLSPQQKHVWILQQDELASPYRAECVVRIEGHIDAEVLRVTLETVVRKFSVLHTTFHCLPGMTIPLQAMGEGGVCWQGHEDLSTSSPQEQKSRIGDLFEKAAQLSFEFEGGRLRTSLVTLSPSENVLLISLPALCTDAIGLKNLVHEIARSYAACLNGEELSEEPMPYTLVCEWWNELLESEDAEPGKDYWRKLEFPTLFDARLPSEKHVPVTGSFKSGVLEREIDTALLAGIQDLADRHGRSLSTFLLTCWQILLWRLGGQSDAIIAASCDGRTDEELRNALGLFAKHLPVPSRLAMGLGFNELWQKTDEGMREIYEWQECFTWEQFGEQMEAANASTPGFFPYGFDLIEIDPPFSAGGLTFSIIKQRVCTSRFKLKLSCVQKNEKLIAEFHYDEALFEAQEIEQLAERFHVLVKSCIERPESAIEELEILGDAERQRLLFEFNDSKAHYSLDNCIHQLVEEQAARTPEGVAAVFNDQELTYAQLNARANQLARRLRQMGVGPEKLVAVSMERSFDLVIGLLAILKAGGAYVPLDPTHPKERLAFIMEDVRPLVVLTQERFVESLPAGAATQIICLDADRHAIEADDDENPDSGVTPDNLAYVIYTSGSTGNPKGVMISHRAICNRLLWMQTTFPIGKGDRVLQKTVFSFDASVWELFVPLWAGARLIMAEPGGHQDSTYMLKTIAEHRVTIFQLVPSMLSVFLEEPGLESCRSLRRVFCGGEVVPVELQKRFFERIDAQLINLYGPTEASIDATFWVCRPEEQARVPIGHPISNMEVYLLDSDRNPVPINLPGELHIGGVGLARGYQNRPDLTAEKFVPHPFAKEEGRRLYRTGDLARYCPDGAIEFLGRLDYQVKIRGFRIEPGEIEATLSQHGSVRDVCVLAREDEPGETRLVAYLVPEKISTPSDEQLYCLPNQVEIAHLNKNETDLLYEEIFGDQNYLRHGITINDGDCIFDVGANIGLFTLFVFTQCRNARVYAFEPIPKTCETLRANVALYGLDVKVSECGLSDHMGQASFTFYPKVSASSGMYADALEDERVTRAFLANQDERLVQYADELMEGRFKSEKFTCELKTLSDVISENSVERIDLLKIDAEKSELDVLHGIRENDWKKIAQIVMEVHDKDTRMLEISDLLSRHGFKFTVEQDPAFKQTGLYHIYAISPERKIVAQQRNGSAGTALSLRKMTLNVSDLRGFLKERVPEYMIPAAFVMLNELPALPNGKVDRRALPVPDAARPELQDTFLAPSNFVEERLAAIWAEVLGIERIGVNDNFFDLGGHSLLATQVVSRLREEFKVKMPLTTIFNSPTVGGIAPVILKGLTENADGEDLDQLLAEIEHLSDSEAQLVLAQRTGNFDR